MLLIQNVSDLKMAAVICCWGKQNQAKFKPNRIQPVCLIFPFTRRLFPTVFLTPKLGKLSFDDSASGLRTSDIRSSCCIWAYRLHLQWSVPVGFFRMSWHQFHKSPDCRKLSLVTEGSLFTEARYVPFCSLLTYLSLLRVKQWFLTWAIMPPMGRFHFSGGR